MRSEYWKKQRCDSKNFDWRTIASSILFQKPTDTNYEAPGDLQVENIKRDD